MRRLEAHILQVDTGCCPATRDPAGDARYDLRTTTVNERVAAKVAELAGTDLAVSVRQFHRLRVAYRADGAVGLVERRVRDRLAGRDPLAGVDERVLTALRDGDERADGGVDDHPEDDVRSGAGRVAGRAR